MGDIINGGRVINLGRRLTKLEGTGASDNFPGPEADILHAGPRDPHAIIHALGLEMMPELTAEVWEGDLRPNEPPKLVGGIRPRGRAGMCPAQQEFSREAGRCFGSGRAWSFYRTVEGRGFVLDRSVSDRFIDLEPIPSAPEGLDNVAQ